MSVSSVNFVHFNWFMPPSYRPGNFVSCTKKQRRGSFIECRVIWVSFRHSNLPPTSGTKRQTLYKIPNGFSPVQARSPDPALLLYVERICSVLYRHSLYCCLLPSFGHSFLPLHTKASCGVSAWPSLQNLLSSGSLSIPCFAS